MGTSNIGALIRLHRKTSGLSQEELAQLAGVGKTIVFDIEHGKLSIRFEKLMKILTALNISIELKSPIMNELQAELEQNKKAKKKK